MPEPIAIEGAGARVEALRAALGGRASGLWGLEGDRMVLLAFAPGPGMPAEVASGFAGATRSVPLNRLDLGIAKAAVERKPVVSVAEGLPDDAGSGGWLRAFDAERSVAVPLIDGEGAVRGVLSVALPAGHPLDDEGVADVVRRHGAPFCN